MVYLLPPLSSFPFSFSLSLSLFLSLSLSFLFLSLSLSLLLIISFALFRVLCRKAAAELSSIKSELEGLDIQLLAIGSGTPFMAKAFAKEFNFTGNTTCPNKYEEFLSLFFFLV